MSVRSAAFFRFGCFFFGFPPLGVWGCFFLVSFVLLDFVSGFFFLLAVNFSHRKGGRLGFFHAFRGGEKTGVLDAGFGGFAGQTCKAGRKKVGSWSKNRCCFSGFPAGCVWDVFARFSVFFSVVGFVGVFLAGGNLFHMLLSVGFVGGGGLKWTRQILLLFSSVERLGPR